MTSPLWPPPTTIASYAVARRASCRLPRGVEQGQLRGAREHRRVVGWRELEMHLDPVLQVGRTWVSRCRAGSRLVGSATRARPMWRCRTGEYIEAGDVADLCASAGGAVVQHRLVGQRVLVLAGSRPASRCSRSQSAQSTTMPDACPARRALGELAADRVAADEGAVAVVRGDAAQHPAHARAPSA